VEAIVQDTKDRPVSRKMVIPLKSGWKFSIRQGDRPHSGESIAVQTRSVARMRRAARPLTKDSGDRLFGNEGVVD
jgi:hypothetical protein